MILDQLFRPDRNLLRLICHPQKPALKGEVFEFTGPFFISEILISLPSKETDLSCLESGFLNDIDFQETGICIGDNRNPADTLTNDLKPLDITAFQSLLLDLHCQLLANISTIDSLGFRQTSSADGSSKLHRSVEPSVFVKRIEKAIKFIKDHKGIFTLEFYYADEWI